MKRKKKKKKNFHQPPPQQPTQLQLQYIYELIELKIEINGHPNKNKTRRITRYQHLPMAVATETQVQPAKTLNTTSLLENIQISLSSAASSLPTSGTTESEDTKEASKATILPPQDGISLLDAKNDILLSYLHNVTFLILFQIRRLSSSSGSQSDSKDESFREEAVKKLMELRVYLDRGVKPLEGRLKYQVDKVIKAAEDAERAGRGTGAKTDNGGKSKTGKIGRSSEDGSSSDEDESGSDDDSEEDEDDSDDGEDIDEMAYRPNVSALSKAVEPEEKPQTMASRSTADGIYRPPKIMPTALPTTENRRREREDRRVPKSNVIDEFVTSEMSSAPMTEASIGSTIRAGGRQMRTRKEREDEAERQMFEETHFTRLPKESKKERAKKRGRRGPESTFGGEEWRGLGEGADRISRLTRQSKGSGNVLDRSRKRKLTEDIPRSDGASVGNVFEKRRKKIEGWKR